MQSGRYWTTVALFLALNMAGWVAWLSVASPPADLLRVEALTDPTKPLARDGELRWRFSLPMATDGQIPVRLSPEPDGQWRWEGNRQLVFAAERPLPRATRFTWRMASHSRSRDGFVLEDSVEGMLHTAALALRGVEQVGSDPGHRYLLAVNFDQPVRGTDVLAHSELIGPDGRPIKLEMHAEPGAGRVLLRTEALDERLGAGPRHKVTFRVRAGLRGTEGPLPLPTDLGRQLVLTDHLVATGLSAYSPAEGRPHLNLRFTNRFSRSALEEVLRIEPSVPFTVSGWGSSASIDGDFQPGTRYTVTIERPAEGFALNSDQNEREQRRFPRPATLSVTVPDRQTRLWFPDGDGFLAAAGQRALTLKAMNVERLNVRLHRLYPDNLPAWIGLARGRRGKVADLGEPVAEVDLPVDVVANQLQELRLDLDDMLPEGTAADGTWLIRVGGDPLPGVGGYRHRHWASVAVTCADLGLHVRLHDQGRLGAVAWATGLSDGTPIAGARVRWYSDHLKLLGESSSDASGLADLVGVDLPDGERPRLVVVEHEGSATWVDLERHRLDDAGANTAGLPWARDSLRAWLSTGRDLFRPGERLHLRGLVRDGSGALPGAFPVAWHILRPDRRTWRVLNGTVDDQGSTALDLDLPGELPPGRWTAELRIPGSESPALGSLGFRVKDFVPDRLAMAFDGTPDSHHLATGPLVVTTKADWLFGAPASGQTTSLLGTLSRQYFRADNQPTAVFHDQADVGNGPRGQRHRITPKDLIAGADGRSSWTLDRKQLLGSVQGAGPWRLDLAAEVLDDGGRASAAGHRLLIHDAPHYVGIDSSEPWLPSGESWSVDLHALSADGSPSSDVVAGEVQLYREVWDRVLVENGNRYRWHSERKLTPSGEALAVRIVDGQARLTLPIPGDGTWICAWSEAGQVLASRRIRSGGSNWYGGDDRHPERLSLELVEPGPLKAGEQRAVLIEAPFAGSCLITVEQDMVIYRQVIELSEARSTITLPVEADWGPNAYLSATVIRPLQSDGGWAVHRARGMLPITMDGGAHELQAELSVPEQAPPFGELPVHVQLTDSLGQPLGGAPVSIAVVDEGILRLSNFASPDPLAWRLAKRALAVRHGDGFDRLLPELPGSGLSPNVGGDGDEGWDPRYASPVASRDIRNLAWRSDWISSDADGTVNVSVPMGAFTGAVRVMAVMHQGDRYRSLSAQVSVRGPLQVLPSWPRFTSPGDTLSVPVTVRVQPELIGKPLRIEVHGTAEGSKSEAKFTAGKAIEMIAETSQTLRIPLQAGPTIGEAPLRLEVSVDGQRWVESQTIPIRPPSPATSAGGFVEIPAGSSWQVPELPELWAGSGSWQLRAGNQPDLGLLRGLERLQRYPYGCAEQTVSAALPLISLVDLAPDLGFDETTLRSYVDDAIARLQLMQTDDGGLAMWPGQRSSWPWASAYATHFLLSAKEAGYTVPEAFLSDLLDWCSDTVDDRSGDPKRSLATRAYACWNLARAKRPVAARLNALQREVDHSKGSVPASARLHLPLAWLANGRRDRAAGLLPEQVPNFRSERSHTGSLASPVRDRALLLDTLLSVDPEHPAIPGLVQVLAASGAEDGWVSTQDRAFALMALGHWRRNRSAFKAHGGLTLSDADGPLATAAAGTELRWSWADGVPPAGLTLSVAEGAGPVHLAWLRTGIPRTPPASVDQGLEVRRRVLDRHGNPRADGPLRSGEAIIVELSLGSDRNIGNLVVEDLLPAGLEVEHPDLASSMAAHDRHQHHEPAHVQRRDDRVIWFTDGYGHRTRTLRYLARATVAGTYAWPPVRAEAMYDHGVHSIGTAGTLQVQAAP